MIELPRRSPDAVPVLTDGPLSCAVFPWQLVPGQDALIVAAKLTVEIGLDGSTRLAEEPYPLTGDQHIDAEDETSSLRYASDFEPFKPKADLLLVGDAYATSGTRLQRAGFRFNRIDHTLAAIGDRQWEGGVPGTPAPLRKIPLSWEHAFGGPGHPSNPAGRGFAEGGAAIRLPNLEREGQLIASRGDRPQPICFAPIAREWPQRRAGLGTYGKRWLEERWPYYPEDHDLRMCNAAAAEQQIQYPRGDESFEFFSLRPEVPVLSAKLPGHCPRVLAQYGKQNGYLQQELALHLDTVWFDSDALVAVLVWRGQMPVSAEGAPELGLLFACVDNVAAPQPLVALRERLSATLNEPREEAPAPMSRAIGFGRSLFGALASSSFPNASDSNEPEGQARSEAEPEEALPAVEPSLPRAKLEALLATAEALDGLELAHCDLTELDFSGRSMEGADLTGASVSGARFDGAKLNCASLAGMRGSGVSFRGAELREANLANAKLRTVDFREAELSDANCEEMELIEAQGAGARASAASFAGATLTDVDFKGAQLDQASFDNARLRRVSFEGARLEQARFYEAQAAATAFVSARLIGLRADEAELTECQFTNADASGASFQAANLERADFSGANLDDAVLMHAKASLATFNRCCGRRARFDGAVLAGARLARANLMQANFTGANLQAAQFLGANLWQAELWKAKCDDAVFDGAFLQGSKLERAAKPGG